MMNDQPNLSIVDEMSGGSEDIKKQIIEIVIEEFPQEKEDYFTYLKENNFLRLKETVHKIKHKIHTLGMSESYVIAEEYENNIRLGTLELSNDFHHILEVISNFLKKF